MLVLLGGVVIATTRHLHPMSFVTVPVPDVVGLPSAEAEAALRRVGLTPSRRTIESSREVVWDRVLQQSPSAGLRAQRGQKVAILLAVREGTRPVGEEAWTIASYEQVAEAAPPPRARPTVEPEQVAVSIGVPRVTGKSEAAARRALRAVGLGMKIAKRPFSRTVPRGRVIRQYPLPGEAPPTDENVRVVVSRGRAPRHEARPISRNR